jgi:flagellin-like protein
MNHKRRGVAPVIATLLMVAIAVVGGMLVFVFAQDFFQSTDTMTGPTIEVLHIYGYDARDVADGVLENHAGAACTVNGAAGGTLADDDVFAIYVRNLASNDVIISDVRVFNNSGTAGASAALSVTVPAGATWVVITGDTCGTGTAGSGTAISGGQDATILIAHGTGAGEFGDAVKSGRPIFVSVETGSGSVFKKQLINGRQA